MTDRLDKLWDDVHGKGGIKEELQELRVYAQQAVWLLRVIVGGGVTSIVGAVVVALVAIFSGGLHSSINQASNQTVSLSDSEKPPSQREFYTVREVAWREGVNEDTVRRWLGNGLITSAIKADGRWIIGKEYAVLDSASKDARKKPETGTP